MTPPARRGITEIAILVAVIFAGAVITWYRVPEGHRDRVWAEDGNIFLGEAVQHGAWAVLFDGYAGYQHFVPRLVLAVLFPFLDLASYPVVIFAICAALTGLTAGAVFWLSRDVIPWMPARVTIGLITVVMPLATQETVGNLADFHSYAMWLTPWLLLYRPRTWWSSAGWALIAWATVMTEIQAVFFVFLIFFRLRTRDRRQWPVLAAFVVGATVQVATVLTVDRGTGNGPLSLASTVVGWMINSVMPVVTADPDVIRGFVTNSGLLVALLVLIPIASAAIFALVKGTGDQRLLTVSLLLGSAAVYTGSAWVNSGEYFAYAEVGLANIDRLAVNIRYGVVAGMMLVAVVPLSAAILVRHRAPAVMRTATGWIVCGITLAVLAHGSTMTLSIRDWVPQWSTAVNTAVVDCGADPGLESVSLPVAPDRAVELSCDAILELSPE